MKWWWAGGVAVFLAGSGVLVWQLNQTPVPAIRLAPAHAEIFIACPDLSATLRRWPETTLAQIMAEPGVSRFVGHPWRALPKAYPLIWADLIKLQPTSAFFCSADVLHRGWLLGIRCSKDLRSWQHEAEILADNNFGGHFYVVDPEASTGSLRAKDLPGTEVYGMRIGNWLLFAPEPEPLKAALGQSSQAHAGLETNEIFTKCQGKVPADADVLTFLRGPMMDLFAVPGSGETGPREGLMATTRLEGREIRDQVFTLHSGAPADRALDRKLLDAADPNALFYLGTHLTPSVCRRWVQAAAVRFPWATAADQYLQALQESGMRVDDLDRLLGDVGIVVARNSATGAIEPVVNIDVTDPGRFWSWTSVLINQKFAGRSQQVEIEQVPAYLLRVGSQPMTLLFGMVDRRLVLASSPSAFAETVRRLRVHQAGLQESERYRRITAMVSPPTEAFAYLDGKSTFECVYAALRPMAVLGSAFVPTLAHYVDPFTLPETDEVSRHLTPIVFSRHRLPEGTIDESVGPITAYQALILAFGAGVACGVVQDGQG
ncbi:MAG TPA: hypothetical protein VGD78_21635 [Chthoniobacterales bacterium]